MIKGNKQIILSTDNRLASRNKILLPPLSDHQLIKGMHIVILIVCVVVLKLAVLYFGSAKKDWKKDVRAERKSTNRPPSSAHGYTVLQHGDTGCKDDCKRKKIVVIGAASSILAR